jgi:hypothetical protein
VQAIDFKQLTDSQKQAKQSESFMENAFGLKVNPSNTNMYESHFQLAKDKANLLFSDEVLQHYAKDKRGMAEWSAKVDQLNNEISGYEAYYEDSFGDPSKATGQGNTWADHAVRAKHPGGEEGFWSDMGVEADRTSGLNDMMKIVDSRQHSSMKFNFETGEFDYERLVEQDGVPVGIDPFNVNPQSANELFSYNLTQTVFESPTDYAEKDMFVRVVDSKDQFDERMEKQRTSDSFNRTIADYYIKQTGQDLSIDEVLQNPEMMNDAFDDFKDQTYSNIKENEKITKRKAAQAKASKSTKLKASFGSAVESNDTKHPVSSVSSVPIQVLVMDDGVGTTIKTNTISINKDGFTVVDKDRKHYPISQQDLANVIGVEETKRLRAELFPSMSKIKDEDNNVDNVLDSEDIKWEKTKNQYVNKRSNLSDKFDQDEELEKYSKLIQSSEEAFVRDLHRMFPESVKVEGESFSDYVEPSNPIFKIEEVGMLGDRIKITHIATGETLDSIDMDSKAGSFAIDTGASDEGKKSSYAKAEELFEFINKQR